MKNARGQAPRYQQPNFETQDTVFMGRWQNYDLYFLPKVDGGTIETRFGDEAHEYQSMSADSIGRVLYRGGMGHIGEESPLRAGYEEAVKRGLVNIPPEEPKGEPVDLRKRR